MRNATELRKLMNVLSAFIAFSLDLRMCNEPYEPWPRLPSGALHVDSTVPDEEEISEDDLATDAAHCDGVGCGTPDQDCCALYQKKGRFD